jgi:hypothetical protein
MAPQLGGVSQHGTIMNSTHKLVAIFLSLAFPAASAGAQDIEYLLTNNTSSTLLENDLLSDSDLNPGESAAVLIGDGRSQCDYDVYFVFEDGSEVTDTVNICELGSYELTD